MWRCEIVCWSAYCLFVSMRHGSHAGSGCPRPQHHLLVDRHASGWKKKQQKKTSAFCSSAFHSISAASNKTSLGLVKAAESMFSTAGTKREECPVLIESLPRDVHPAICCHVVMATLILCITKEESFSDCVRLTVFCVDVCWWPKLYERKTNSN